MKRIMLMVALMGGLLIGTTAPVQADHDAIENHCPDHNGNPGKDESGSDDNDLVVEAGTLICVKAGNENSNPPGGATGIIETDGVTTLREYLEAAGIVDGTGEQGRNVSYWINYGPAPEPISAFVCFEGEITVITNEDGDQTALNLAVTAFLEANEGAVQVLSEEDVCEVSTTTTSSTTTSSTTTTTAPPAPPATDTVPPAPQPVAAPAPVAAPQSAPAPAQQLPRTGSGAMLLALAGGALTLSGGGIRLLSRLSRRGA